MARNRIRSLDSFRQLIQPGVGALGRATPAPSTEYMELPYTYNFSDMSIGDGVALVGNESGFTKYGNGGWNENDLFAETGDLADSNSYTPSGVTKVVSGNLSAVSLRSAKFTALGAEFPSSTTLRMEVRGYERNMEAKGVQYVLGLVKDNEANDWNTSLVFWPYRYNSNSAWYLRYADPVAYPAGGYPVSSTSGSPLGPNRWHKFRLEVDFTAKTAQVWYIREEDASQVFNETKSSLSDLADSTSDWDSWFVGTLNGDNTDATGFISQIWIGTASDDWPT